MLVVCAHAWITVTAEATTDNPECLLYQKVAQYTGQSLSNAQVAITMINRNPSLKLTHVSGIEVIVERRGSWFKTMQVALRILKARLYARQKGIAKIESGNAFTVREVRDGEFAVDVEINGNWFIVTLPRSIPLS